MNEEHDDDAPNTGYNAGMKLEHYIRKLREAVSPWVRQGDTIDVCVRVAYGSTGALVVRKDGSLVRFRINL